MTVFVVIVLNFLPFFCALAHLRHWHRHCSPPAYQPEQLKLALTAAHALGDAVQDAARSIGALVRGLEARALARRDADVQLTILRSQLTLVRFLLVADTAAPDDDIDAHAQQLSRFERQFETVGAR